MRLATRVIKRPTKVEIIGEPRISPNINPIRWLNEDCVTNAIPHKIDDTAVPKASIKDALSVAVKSSN